jgi:hypothetical protein
VKLGGGFFIAHCPGCSMPSGGWKHRGECIDNWNMRQVVRLYQQWIPFLYLEDDEWEPPF